MKKKFLISMLLIVTAFILMPSCKSDKEDEPKNYNSELWGTWVNEKSQVNQSTGVVISVVSTWIFKTNNTCSWVMDYKLDDKIIQSLDVFPNYEYNYNGTDLKLKGPDGTEGEIRLIVSGNTMTIVTEEGESLTHYKK